MTIELITIEEHKKLLGIFTEYPNLTLQNKGYEYIDKSKFSDTEKIKHEEVVTILKKTIRGFSSFSNFYIDSKQRIQIRVQYDYSWGETTINFIGVGYVLLDELLNGFETKI